MDHSSETKKAPKPGVSLETLNALNCFQFVMQIMLMIVNSKVRTSSSHSADALCKILCSCTPAFLRKYGEVIFYVDETAIVVLTEQRLFQ